MTDLSVWLDDDLDVPSILDSSPFPSDLPTLLLDEDDEIDDEELDEDDDWDEDDDEDANDWDDDDEWDDWDEDDDE